MSEPEFLEFRNLQNCQNGNGNSTNSGTSINSGSDGTVRQLFETHPRPLKKEVRAGFWLLRRL